MEHSRALTELLDQQTVWLEEANPLDNSRFKVGIQGVHSLVFARELRKHPNVDANDELHYVVHTIPHRRKVRLVIFKKAALLDGSRALAKDAGDLWSMSMRKRVVQAVYKLDYDASQAVEQDLPRLATWIPSYVERREQILLEHIRNSDNAELKARLQQLEQPSPEFPKKTADLLAFIDQLPTTAPEGEPCHARFTLQQLAGKMGLTINQVRPRFSPLEGQSFIRLVQRGRGNQPMVYSYLKENRGTKTQREATISSDTEIIAAPKVATSARHESKELLRYGEKPKEWSY